MPTNTHDVDQASVALLGTFQVGRSLPKRLVETGVLTEADGDDVQVNALLPDELLIFETQFVTVSVEKSKISVTSKPSAPLPEKVTDFASRYLAEQELPISALGINRDLHIKVATQTKYREIRDKLINASPWESILRNPLVRSLDLQCDRYDSQSGQINVRIETSLLFPQAVYVQVNDHVDLPAGRSPVEVAGFLPQMWSRSMENSDVIVAQVRKFCQ